MQPEIVQENGGEENRFIENENGVNEDNGQEMVNINEEENMNSSPVAVQAIYASELSVNDQRANKRRRWDDVISDMMDMDNYLREITFALNRLAKKVDKNKEVVLIENGESSNGDMNTDDVVEQGNT